MKSTSEYLNENDLPKENQCEGYVLKHEDLVELLEIYAKEYAKDAIHKLIAKHKDNKYYALTRGGTLSSLEHSALNYIKENL